MLDPDHVALVAAEIGAARRAGRTLTAPSGGRPLTPAEAYEVQRLRTAQRLARGERRVGWKLGYTSAAMRRQMGVRHPNLGPLTDAMLRPSGAVVGEGLLQPRVEPEVAVVLGRPLAGPVHPAEALAAVAAARAALEVVDSVWTDYRFTWEDNTADESSAALVVLGPDLPLADLGDVVDGAGDGAGGGGGAGGGRPVRLLLDGSTVGEGSTAAAMGHPAAALAWLSRELGDRGLTLRTGDIVITGGLTAAVPLEPGEEVAADIAGGRVSVRRAARRP